MTRVYELMIIVNGDLEEDAVDAVIERSTATVEAGGGTVAAVDRWGKRRFAYEIDHRQEGHYVVMDIVTDGPDLHDLNRQLRLADEVVRYKTIRLPEDEATRRGLLGDAPTPAPAEEG